MILIHQILNVACLLLWLNWRSIGFVTIDSTAKLSLLLTLKRTEPKFAARWLYLVSLLALLLIRGLFYWHMGSATNWTPVIDLIAITLPFRSDYFLPMLIFSASSFGLLLAGFYGWLLLISAVNHKVTDSDPFQKLLRFHLGWLERFPAIMRFFLPTLIAALLWVLVNPGLERLGIIPAPVSTNLLWQQAALLGIAAVLVWKFLLLGLLLLHLLNTYVYLGNAPFWHFVNLTARSLFRPVAWLPLRIGRVDLSPVVGIAAVLFIETLGRNWLPLLYQRLPF